MGAAVGLREDFGADELRRLAAKVKDATPASPSSCRKNELL